MAWLWPLTVVLVPLAVVGLMKLAQAAVDIWDALVLWLGSEGR